MANANNYVQLKATILTPNLNRLIQMRIQLEDQEHRNIGACRCR